VAEHDSQVLQGERTISIERLTYATVVLMSVLVVYDGWEQLTTFIGVAVVIIGPILALAVAHFFSAVLHAYAERQRPLSGRELLAEAAHQAPVMLAAVPSLIVLGLGWISPLDARNTITLIVWTGAATLIALAALAGRRAGLRGWRLIAMALSGGLVGLMVISLQILLKPY
jgi:hypothetical protein